MSLVTGTSFTKIRLGCLATIPQNSWEPVSANQTAGFLKDQIRHSPFPKLPSKAVPMNHYVSPADNRCCTASASHHAELFPSPTCGEVTQTLTRCSTDGKAGSIDQLRAMRALGTPSHVRAKPCAERRKGIMGEITDAFASAALAFFNLALQASRSRRRFSRILLSF